MIRESGTPINEVIARVRAIPQKLAQIASDACDDIQADLARAYGSVQSPDGTPWAPREDGSRALPNAIDGIVVAASGNSITLTVLAPYTYHQKRRPMLPAALPAAWSDAIRAAVMRALERK